MFKSSRRRMAEEAQQRAELVAQHEVNRVYGELVALFRDLPNSAGSRVVAGIGPKGGSGKTTALVAAAYVLSQVVTGDLILVDVNPDKSNVRERLLRAGQRGTLLELIEALGTLYYPTQLARFQVPINRVKLIHKDGLRSIAVQRIPAAKWYELLETLSWFGQLVLADGGLSLVSPAAEGSLSRADHVVLAVEADPVVIQKTLEAVNEVMAGDPTVQSLTLGATVVVAYTNPTAELDPLLEESIEYLRRTFAGVFVVPYDAAAAVSGLVPFDRLAVATQDAYLRVALHVAQCFHRPPRATQAHGSLTDEAGATALPDVFPGNGGQRAVEVAPAGPGAREAMVQEIGAPAGSRDVPVLTGLAPAGSGRGADVGATGPVVEVPIR